MRDLNRVVVEGRATDDAQFKATEEGNALAVFSVAVNYDEKASFFKVVSFGSLAEKIVCPYVKKGKALLVYGWLAQNGNNGAYIVAKKITLR